MRRRNVRLESFLRPDEIRALRIAEEVSRRTNENLKVIGEIGLVILQSPAGRKVLISILKAIRTFVNAPFDVFSPATASLFDKAMSFLSSLGVNVSITGQEIVEVLKKFYFVTPGGMVGIGADGLIKILEGITDKEYQDIVSPHKESKESDPKADTKNEPAPDLLPGSPAMAESLIRRFVREQIRGYRR